jgi:hypothetical protein
LLRRTEGPDDDGADLAAQVRRRICQVNQQCAAIAQTEALDREINELYHTAPTIGKDNLQIRSRDGQAEPDSA